MINTTSHIYSSKPQSSLQGTVSMWASHRSQGIHVQMWMGCKGSWMKKAQAKQRYLTALYFFSLPVFWRNNYFAILHPSVVWAKTSQHYKAYLQYKNNGCSGRTQRMTGYSTKSHSEVILSYSVKRFILFRAVKHTLCGLKLITFLIPNLSLILHFTNLLLIWQKVTLVICYIVLHTSLIFYWSLRQPGPLDELI